MLWQPLHFLFSCTFRLHMLCRLLQWHRPKSHLLHNDPVPQHLPEVHDRGSTHRVPVPVWSARSTVRRQQAGVHVWPVSPGAGSGPHSEEVQGVYCLGCRGISDHLWVVRPS